MASIRLEAQAPPARGPSPILDPRGRWPVGLRWQPNLRGFALILIATRIAPERLVYV